MDDEKSFLDQLAEYYNQNKINRQEETNSLNDFPKSGEYGPRQRSFTRDMLASNPNLPQDDVREYVSNVKDDRDAMMSDIGGMSGGVNMLKEAGKKILPKVLPQAKSMIREVADEAPRYIKDLSEEYLPKNISDKVSDVYNNIKSGQNIKRLEKADIDNARIKGLEDLANQKPVFEAEIPKDQKPFDLDIFQKNLDIDNAIAKQEAEKLARLKKLKDNPEEFTDNLEKTVTSTRTR